MDPSQRMVFVSSLDCTIKVFFDDSLKFFLSLYGHKLPALALDAADDDRHIAIGLFQSLAVDGDGAVRAFPRDVPRGIGIVITAFSVRGVMVDHGVHVARGNAEKQVGLAECGEGFSGLPVGLREHAHPEAQRFKNTADDCHAETGVIYVAVYGDNDDVAAVPPQLLHLGSGHRQPWRRPETFCPVLAVAKE